jgi:non-canonical (house-cleaning) NTP pyrophosphatase
MHGVPPSPLSPSARSLFSTNSKQKGGTVGKLTNGLVDRTEYYRHAMLMALIPFMPINQSLY